MKPMNHFYVMSHSAISKSNINAKVNTSLSKSGYNLTVGGICRKQELCQAQERLGPTIEVVFHFPTN
jgi:hypothetical protein